MFGHITLSDALHARFSRMTKKSCPPHPKDCLPLDTEAIVDALTALTSHVPSMAHAPAHEVVPWVPKCPTETQVCLWRYLLRGTAAAASCEVAFLRQPCVDASQVAMYLDVGSRHKTIHPPAVYAEMCRTWLPFDDPCHCFLDAMYPAADVWRMIRILEADEESGKNNVSSLAAIVFSDLAGHGVTGVVEALLHATPSVSFWFSACHMIAPRVPPTEVLAWAHATSALLDAFPPDTAPAPSRGVRLLSEPLAVHRHLESTVRSVPMAWLVTDRHSQGSHAPKHLRISWHMLCKRLHT